MNKINYIKIINKNQFNYFSFAEVFFLILLPYATFGLFQSDVSPFYLVGLFFIILRHKKKDFELISIVILILIIFFLFFGFDVNFLKFVVTVPLIYLLINTSRYKQIKENHIVLIAFIWLISGLITLYKVDAFSFINYRVLNAGNTSRGAIGFLPEPAYYGNSSVFLLALSFEIWVRSTTKGSKLAIIFFGISVIISLSAYAFFMLSLVAVYYLTFYRQYLKILALIIFIGITFFVIIEYFAWTRLSKLFLLFLTNPELLLLDESIRFRVFTFVDVFKALSFQSDGIKSGITSGMALLVYKINYLSFIVLIPFFYGLRLNRVSFKNLFFFLIFTIVAFVGPISIPYFWLWISSKIYMNNNAS
jgi:hypothetical protein